MPLKDRVSPEVRSRIMSRIRSKETKPEVDFRRGCRLAGLLGYRKNWGKPSVDVVWTRLKVAVFIDSCFWHVCPDHGQVPDSDWWRKKLEANVGRDQRATEHYTSRGWLVLRFWTHTPIEEMVDATGDAIRPLRAGQGASGMRRPLVGYFTTENVAVLRDEKNAARRAVTAARNAVTPQQGVDEHREAIQRYYKKKDQWAYARKKTAAPAEQGSV